MKTLGKARKCLIIFAVFLLTPVRGLLAYVPPVANETDRSPIKTRFFRFGRIRKRGVPTVRKGLFVGFARRSSLLGARSHGLEIGHRFPYFELVSNPVGQTYVVPMRLVPVGLSPSADLWAYSLAAGVTPLLTRYAASGDLAAVEVASTCTAPVTSPTSSCNCGCDCGCGCGSVSTCSGGPCPVL